MKQNTVGHTTLHDTQYNKTHNSLGHHKKEKEENLFYIAGLLT